MTVGTIPLHTPARHGDVTYVRNGRFHVSKGYDPTVRVSEEMLKCVAFVGEGIPGEVEDVLGELYATGFFVSLPAESPELRRNGDVFTYFVTAKHVASDLQGRPVYFLVNKKGGGVTHIDTIVGDWWLHPPDPSV